MKIIKVDPLDGKQPIEVIVNDDDAFRLLNFISDARDYFMREVKVKQFQVELTATKGAQSVYTCSTVKASTRLRAISKAVRESKKCGHSDQREIKAIVSESDNYKNLVF